MRRYRVESKGEGFHFKVDCYEEKLEYWKLLCKHDAKFHRGRCYYREFPLTGSKKIFY